MIRWPLALASTVVLGMPLAARSQEPVAVSVVLSAFVPDSGASTVAWTAGDELPLRWASPGPVPLWLNWNCGHDGCGIALQSSPSPSELAGIECIGGS